MPNFFAKGTLALLPPRATSPTSPTPASTAEDAFAYTLTDAMLTSVSATVTLDVNGTPIANDYNYVFPEGTHRQRQHHPQRRQLRSGRRSIHLHGLRPAPRFLKSHASRRMAVSTVPTVPRRRVTVTPSITLFPIPIPPWLGQGYDLPERSRSRPSPPTTPIPSATAACHGPKPHHR